MEKLLSKIKNRTAIIGIIGLGYVGLPLLLRFCESGFSVIGLDIDVNKIQKLKQGHSYIKHITNESIIHALNHGCKVTNDFTVIQKVDAIILCLPTPLTKHKEPDLSYILNTMDLIKPYLCKHQVISLESTTYPGTTEEEIVPIIQNAGFTVGEDYFVVYSPEREDPANPIYNTQNIPKLVGGITKNCLQIGAQLYKGAVDVIVEVSSTKVAEMAKLLENIYRSVNIGLVNEMKIITDKMGINIYEVIEAAGTKPFGFTKYYPGPGLGGHCIPIDPFYLTWKARQYDLHTRFIELAGEINVSMPNWVVNKIIYALNTHSKAVKGSNILIIGIAYKKNVDDMRESPALEIIKHLLELGAKIQYHDPYVASCPITRRHTFNLSSIQLNEQAINQFDAVIIVTDHTSIDYKLIERSAKLIIDTRGVYKNNKQVIHA